MSLPNRSQLFDEWAGKYDGDVLSDKGNFPFAGYERVLDRLVSLADVKAGMRILDLGTGTGNLAARFVERGCDVWGLDFSPEMLAQTQAKLPRARLVQADLLADWTKELQPPYDRVVCAYVFHEFEFEAKLNLIRQILSKCLLPGGMILVADIAFPDAMLLSAASDYWKWEQDEFYWDAAEALDRCKRCGWQGTYEQISSCAGIFTFSTGAAARPSTTAGETATIF